MSDKPRPRITQASSANVVEFPVRDKPKYNRRAWLKQIKVDPILRPSVFKTAYEIAEYANAETGEFWASPKTIAEGGEWSDGIVMSENTVSEDIGKLEAAGFVECTKRGKRGRGHSSHFRIILKSQPSGISKSAKIPVSTPENPSLGPLKSQPSGMNLREPIEPKSAPHGARTSDADRVEETFEQQIDRFKRPRAPGALDDPYNDPDFIDFGINPTSTVYASS